MACEEKRRLLLECEAATVRLIEVAKDLRAAVDSARPAYFNLLRLLAERARQGNERAWSAFDQHIRAHDC